MKRTALYFGSFNPIHNGHMAIAKYLIDNRLCDELWFVVSPQNPLKTSSLLAPEQDRLEMARIAVEEAEEYAGLIGVCDVEMSMPKPSYTIDTLRKLAGLYPERRFTIVMGADNVDSLDRWKEYEALLEMAGILVYPRSGYKVMRFLNKVTMLNDAPLWNYSSTEVREHIARHRDVHELIPQGVYEYIKANGVYTGKE